MQFSVVALLAAAAGAHAWSNVTYTTITTTAYTTYCPGPTEITYGGQTYTVTEATTLTVTNCPCTLTQAVTTVASVACSTCGTYKNTTSPTGSSPAPTSSVVTAGGDKAAVLSGAALAGIVGVAAFVL